MVVVAGGAVGTTDEGVGGATAVLVGATTVSVGTGAVVLVGAGGSGIRAALARATAVTEAKLRRLLTAS